MSFPVPDSPRTSTGARSGAWRLTSSATCSIADEVPTRPATPSAVARPSDSTMRTTTVVRPITKAPGSPRDHRLRDARRADEYSVLRSQVVDHETSGRSDDAAVSTADGRVQDSDVGARARAEHQRSPEVESRSHGAFRRSDSRGTTDRGCAPR